jgi:predicted PurR-regulated permease PerM
MTLGHLALLVGLALFTWLALDLLLLLVGGILLAVLLRSLATLLAAKTGLRVGPALAVVLVSLVSVLGLVGWLYAPRLAEQVDQLTTTLPAAFDNLTSWFEQYAWGRWVMEQASTGADNGGAIERAAAFLRRMTSGGVALAFVLFSGIYLAAEPGPYVRGLIRLVPLAHRRRAAEVLFATGHALRWWLFGQLIAMVLVGLTMGIGLALIGVPLSLLLGVLAGLFEFIPLIGPVLALGPALLLALADSPQQAAWVLLLYSVVQTSESYIITPLVQRRAVELPPVLTITAQIALSWAAGPVGLVVAVPLTAVVMVVVQMLYLRDALDDEVEPAWAATSRREVREERDGMLAGLLPD